MGDSLETQLRRIMSGQSRGIGSTLARFLLSCVEPVYTAIVGTRNRLFDRALINIARLPKPVISVGNLTTGGTGKTPVVQWIARELIEMSARPAVLMRGYKRSDDGSSSDEEQMLRDSLGVPVVADPNRFIAGQRALKLHPEIDVFVLDDGFQHRRLARDLDIVLIDATNPFGYDHVLPRGMLRESLGGLARVDLVILTRIDLAPPGRLDEIESTIRSRNSNVPILHSNHRLDQVFSQGKPGPLATVLHQKVWAFCGIGNPEAFENSLRKAGVDLIGITRFGDHHAYDASDIDRLQASASRAGASVLLTTEKDFVKIRELSIMLDGAIAGAIPILCVGVRIELSAQDGALFRSLLGATLSGKPKSGAP